MAFLQAGVHPTAGKLRSDSRHLHTFARNASSAAGIVDSPLSTKLQHRLLRKELRPRVFCLRGGGDDAGIRGDDVALAAAESLPLR